MSSKIPPCELKPVKFTEQYISRIEGDLHAFSLTAFEAQTLIEVLNYPSQHVDIKTLERKVPKEFFQGTSNNVAASVKSLIEKGYLQPYQAKKEVLCVLCTKFGRDVANSILSSCFSGSLRFFDKERERLDNRRKRLCADPIGLEIGETRYVNGPKGKIKVVIKELHCSDIVYGAIDGEVQYERMVIADVECPQCEYMIRIEYSFNPGTAWQNFVEITCENCTYQFSLLYRLVSYYEKSMPKNR
ncbi:hypothetical protein MUP01_04360 [Candidatus Bathyarchaeota archaeon]|nr:hypothetical protein [Candidatus Bathyarchaeota archaeon]